MTTRSYSSSDASAPSLSGTVGSLVALLDACLVTGYGSKVAAGWTKPFTGTNSAAFRQGSGSMAYLYVDDNGTTPGGAKDASVRGYLSMTSISSGSRPFPSQENAVSLTSSSVFGLSYRKSNTADATARDWIIVADDKTVYIFIDEGTSGQVGYCLFGFGQFLSYVPGDNDSVFISGSAANLSGNRSGMAILGSTQSSGNEISSYSFTAGDIFLGKSSSNCTFLHSSQFSPETLPVPGRSSLYKNGRYSAQSFNSDILVSSSINSIHGQLRGLCAPSSLMDISDMDMTAIAFLEFDDMPEISSSRGGFVASERYKLVPIVGYSGSARDGAILVNIGDWR